MGEAVANGNGEGGAGSDLMGGAEKGSGDERKEEVRFSEGRTQGESCAG